MEYVVPQSLIKLVKFLKRGKAPGPVSIHNEVLRLGTTTSLFHHLAKLFTSSIQLGYIPTTWKIGYLNKHQSGFRRAKSTDVHLFRLSHSTMESFNRGEHAVAAFLDVKKAFDNVWNNGLRYRIFQLDLPTKMTRWLSDFFSWTCNTSQRKWFLVQPNKPQSRGSAGFCPESIAFLDLRQ